MNSSTSSFKQELKVIAFVLAVVVVWEIAARCVATILDTDRKHIHDFPQIAKKIGESKTPTVLFLGNSLTKWGLKEDIVREELKKKDYAQVEISKVVPVGTAVVDWIYLYKRYFANTEQNPDIVVIVFVSHHVPDLPAIKLPRLARHFVDKKTMPVLFHYDIKDFDDRVKALLAHVSSGFGDQPEHKYRIFDGFIPKFRDGIRAVNHYVYNLKTAKAEARPKTYKRLERLIASLAENKVHGVFVAMPLPEMWDLDPNIEKTVKAGGMTFIDGRQLKLPEEDFYDGYHLGETGAKKYSLFITDEIVKILKEKNK